MFDHFLTYLLQIVIVLDVLGAITYIALGVMRRQNRATAPIEFNGPSVWQRLFARSQPQAIPATDRDFARLHKVLYGFQVGLNR